MKIVLGLALRTALLPRGRAGDCGWLAAGDGLECARPGALPGATALAQAKAAGVFTGTHQRYWDAARRKHGDAAGTRALIEILLAHRTLPSGALHAAMAKAISSGVLDPHVVLIDARREAGGQAAPVIPIGALARYDRPAPALTAYDQLLSGSAP